MYTKKIRSFFLPHDVYVHCETKTQDTKQMSYFTTNLLFQFAGKRIFKIGEHFVK